MGFLWLFRIEIFSNWGFNLEINLIGIFNFMFLLGLHGTFFNFSPFYIYIAYKLRFRCYKRKEKRR
jgi:hypothetical protein